MSETKLLYATSPTYRTLVLQLGEALFAEHELQRRVGAACIALEDGYCSENEAALADAVAAYRANRAEIARLREQIEEAKR